MVAGATVVLTEELLVLGVLAVETLEWELAIAEAIAAAFIWLGVADDEEGEMEEVGEDDGGEDEVMDAEDDESAIGTNSISSEPLTGCEVDVT